MKNIVLWTFKAWKKFEILKRTAETFEAFEFFTVDPLYIMYGK